MNEREIQADCLKRALASASPEPLREAQRLYGLRGAEPRVDSLRAQMMQPSPQPGTAVQRVRPGQILPGESRYRNVHGALVDADRGGILVMDEQAHAGEVA